MSALSLRLTDSVHRHIRVITSAVSEKISALTTEDYIADRAKHARKGEFAKVLDRVPKRQPLAGDELAN